MGNRKSNLVVAGALLVLASACGSSGSSDTQTSATVTVYINELQPSNKSTVTDETGTFDDWVELYNTGTAAADLAGYYVSDSGSNLLKYELPAGVVVPPGGFLLLWADGEQAQGVTHLPFKLSAGNGDSFHLSDPDGVPIDTTKFEIVTTHDSWARFPDATGAFAWCATPTPLALNGAACAAPAAL